LQIKIKQPVSWAAVKQAQYFGEAMTEADIPSPAPLGHGENSRKAEFSLSPLHNSLFREKRNYANLPFMKTIVIANQKGGSGKSTITVHLAAAAEAAGNGPVVISDTDPQGTAADWFNQRKKAGIETPRYSALALSDLLGRSAI
jgi:Mrp family chromosome partitioning ATPase